MKLVGILLVVNSLIVTAYWIATHESHYKSAIVLCSLGIGAGIILTLEARITEYTNPYFGKIKLATEQAVTDANTIADLKKRVEAQSATVDLIAKSAEEARELVDDLTEKSQETDKKLVKIDETTINAQKSLTEIDRAATFATVLLAAQNGNWEAFDQLRKWGDDKSFPLHEMAVNAYVKIRISYGGPIGPGYLNIKWPQGVDPTKSSIQVFLTMYNNLNPIYHAHLVNTVWNRSDIPKKERMAFLIEVIKNSNSLTAKYYAADFFVKATEDNNLKWQPFNNENILQWWKELGDSIQ